MSLKKKMGAALATTALGAALIGGGTFALFTADATNAGNEFQATTVAISDATGAGALSATSYIKDLAPGDHEDGVLKVKNDGKTDVWVKIKDISTNKDDIANNGIGDLFEGAKPLSISYQTTAVKIPKGETKEFTVGYSFPLEAGNEYQGDTGNVTFNIQAVQTRNNTNAAGDGPNSWNN